MEEVARYECVYNRNSKDFKDKSKNANSRENIGEKFNLSAAEAEVTVRYTKFSNQCVESPKFLCLYECFSNPKPMFPSVLKLTIASLHDQKNK